jgi:ATP-dependent helicase/nuclease subunit A
MHVSGDLPERTMSVERTPRLTGWDSVFADTPPAERAERAEPAVPSSDAEPDAADLTDLGHARTRRAARGVPARTPEQDQAIRRRAEPLHLAAGAGSGKTAVLVERFVGAVHEDGVSPDRILAITFTERAAGELRARVSARLRALGEVEAAAATGAAFVGTFHGFCARLLRAHAREAGIEDEFAILDESQASRLRRAAFAAALGEFVGGGFDEAVDLIAAYTADRARATVLGLYAELRSRGQRRPRLPEPKLDEEPATDRPQLSSEEERRAQRRLDERAARSLELWARLLTGFGERYEAAKRDRGGLDFDDLELIAGELLVGDERLRERWASRFDLLMVDELQDVNPRQLALVDALERGNLFTVGDEWQSIYRFRHADVGLFRSRHEQLAPHGQSLRLTRNFRGRAELLEAVNAVFAKRFGSRFTPLRSGREGARERAAWGEPKVELLLSDRRGWPQTGASGWRAAEARALAIRVAELVRAGSVRPGGVAVLVRGTADIDCYEQALRDNGLETIASAGAFWERQEVVDLLAYLRVLADPADEVAVYGALAAAPVELSTDGLALLARAARERNVSLWEAARAGEGGGERVASYCAWLDRQREQVAKTPLPELLELAIDHCELPARLAGEEAGARRLANVRKLVDLVAEWERSEGHDLRGFLGEAAFQQGRGGRLASAEAIAEPDAPSSVGDPDARMPAVEPDAVALMSVHAAKGLEFDVVCVADLGRAPSMGVPDLLVEGERVGVRLLDLDDPEPRPALRYAELSAERREAQAEEEDRIVYVAMTRARERLLLSGAVDFAAWPRERPGAAPIVWLGPALAGELPALCVEAARASERVPRDQVFELAIDGTDVPLRCQLSMAGSGR